MGAYIEHDAIRVVQPNDDGVLQERHHYDNPAVATVDVALGRRRRWRCWHQV
jgi:hypothetical protein